MSPVQPSFTILICARGGSKGVPWKNLLSPHTNSNLYVEIGCRILPDQVSPSQCIVNTDCEKIESYALEAGFQVFKRPSHLAEDSSRIIDVNLHYLQNSSDTSEYIINLSPVAPFLKPGTIDKAIAMLGRGDLCGATISYHHNNSHPFLALKDLGSDSSSYILDDVIRYPRQRRPKTYYPNGCLFFRHRSLIRGDHSTNDLSTDLRQISTEHPESISIDTKADWDLCRAVAEYMKTDPGCECNPPQLS